MNVTTVGIDLAKNVFHLHGVDKRGKVVFRKRLSRRKLLGFVANLPRCLIGMEACGGAHYWAREIEALGHEVRLMAPQYVKPYVKSNKNDYNDAEAICEAVGRENMRFVAIKTVWQQDMQMIHRIRERLIKERTAQANQIRGILGEYGIVMARGIGRLRKEVPWILEDGENGLTELGRELLADMYQRLRELDDRIAVYERRIRRICRSNELCRKGEKVCGVGPLTAT